MQPWKQFGTILTFCVVSCGLFETGQCQSLQNSKDLMTDLLSDYNKLVRPVDNQYEPLILYVGFNLISILDVDEVTQSITINGYFSLNWVDADIKWDPAAYGNIYHFFTANEPFWTPTLVLTTTTQKFKKAGDDWLGIRYDSQGVAYFYPGEFFVSSCTMDITNYPFDQHECTLTFTPWGQIPEEIYVFNTSDKIALSMFTPNGAWELLDTNIQVSSIPSVATYYNIKLNIKRLPRFLVMNVIIPLIFLSLLNLLVFLVPVDSGERISFSITLLLAIAVFMTIISDNLPKTSYPTSIFSYYLLTLLIISNCMTVAVIFNLSIYHTDETKPVPSCLRSFSLFIRCKCFRRRKFRKVGNDIQPNQNQILTLASIMDQTRNDKMAVGQGGPRVGKMEDEIESPIDDEPEVTWKDVGFAFDILFVVIFLLLLIISSAVFFGLVRR
ncbi:hypothetical protein ACF0H5_012919 [Mactra antiquata]